jgi:hypothetical protein
LQELQEKTEELVPVKAMTELVEHIYALDVTAWSDEDFAKLENIIDKAIQLIGAWSIEQRRPLLERLMVAREGAEQGIAPDPAKRPTKAEMKAFISAHL